MYVATYSWAGLGCKSPPLVNGRHRDSHLRVFRKPMPFEQAMDRLAVDLGFLGGLGYVAIMSLQKI